HLMTKCIIFSEDPTVSQPSPWICHPPHPLPLPCFSRVSPLAPLSICLFLTGSNCPSHHCPSLSPLTLYCLSFFLIQTHTHTHTHKHTHTHTPTNINTHKHTHTQTQTHVQANAHARKHTHTHTHTQAHTHTQTHASTNTHTQTNTHTHTHT